MPPPAICHPTRPGALLGVLLFVLWGCGPGDAPQIDTGGQAPSSSAPRLPDVATARPDTATGFENGSEDDRWSTSRVAVRNEAEGVVTVTGFRAARHDSFDRVVITLDADPPTYSAEIASGPAIQCGSGEPVDLRGGAVLLIALEPAQAHDDAGNITVAPRDTVLDLPTLREARIVCDFEGQVQWALGIADAAAFRVLELSDPTRIAVDIQH